MADQLDGAGKVQRPAASHLFLVRLWEESDGGSHSGDATDYSGEGESTHPNVDGTAEREWKGKVQHVVSGESHTFQDLPSLLDFLRAMMPAPAAGTPDRGQATTE
ncbi:MAG: hypothetical protein M3437_00570 [Chloroflexota bacterium]|nr:hypothetical protein [Chloroflexota bacterium]MDQ5866354.1 hypothetical protein [Chloroflexota bacterium]